MKKVLPILLAVVMLCSTAVVMTACGGTTDTSTTSNSDVSEGSKVQSVDDLEGAVIGVQRGTTGDIYASDTVEKGGYGEDNVIRYKAGADAVQALVSDKVQAVIIDNEPAKSFVGANKGLAILDGAWVEEEYAIAIAKDNKDLLEKINKALAELKADGTIQTIVDKYIKA